MDEFQQTAIRLATRPSTIEAVRIVGRNGALLVVASYVGLCAPDGAAFLPAIGLFQSPTLTFRQVLLICGLLAKLLPPLFYWAFHILQA